MTPFVDKVGRQAYTNKNVFLVRGICFALAIGIAAGAQEPTLARLSHEADSDISRASIDSKWETPHTTRPATSALPESTLARPASQALFARGNLERARVLATQALRLHPGDPEALFVRMEVAAMEDDSAAVLDAAIRLCEAGQRSTHDTRVLLAAVRVRESAANTPAFRAAVPRIKTLLANSQEQWPELRAALLDAAMDGTPGLDPKVISRANGILTDWRIVGPLARRLPGSDDGISHAGDLSAAVYQNRVVENFEFPDGRIVLPDYLPHHGTFYGATHFASLTPATWRVDVENAAGAEVYVDGRRVMRADRGPGHHSSTFDASPGPHRVMMEFTASAAPLRVTITPASDEIRPTIPSRLSLQELTYLMAASHYVTGDFESAAQQIIAVPQADASPALQFLAAQSETQANSAPPGGLAAWSKLHSLAPAALSANDALAEQALAQRDLATAVRIASAVVSARPSDARALSILTAAWEPNQDFQWTEDEIWARRMAEHPSCLTLRQAMSFYRGQGDIVQASSAQQRLDGCAPESLDYAKSLSGQGSHAESAQALRQLISAAPLNRDARLMLVRELQLAGQDDAAQRAAAEWLHVAPNANEYHRLAAAAEPDSPADQDEDEREAFYVPYRRDASNIVRESAHQDSLTEATVLVEDHVAIARPDGSDSLYVHTVKRLRSDRTGQQAGSIALPQGAQVLALRIVHADGSSAAINQAARRQPAPLNAGDAIEEEYVINYTGDGGISQHCEAFQFVFGNFGEQVLHARFVVLTPAEQSDRGVVIATGGAPVMSEAVHQGMLRRVWDVETPPTSTVGSGSPIIRVVEEENGWATPSSAEHQRRIETIHPGPRPADS